MRYIYKIEQKFRINSPQIKDGNTCHFRKIPIYFDRTMNRRTMQMLEIGISF